jgi:hypothetical protein
VKVGARTRRRGERGSAVVEFAILLPIYTALLFGVILLGDATLVRQEIEQAGALYSLAPGLQTKADLAGTHFVPFEGSILDFQDVEDVSDVYDDELIIDALERIGTGEFFVHYEITPTGLQTKITGGERTWQGKYIDDHDLENDLNMQLIVSVLNGWISRNEAEIEYNYNPFFLGSLFEDLAQALSERGDTSESLNQIMYEGVTMKGTGYTAARGPLERPVESGGGSHPIEAGLLQAIDGQGVRFPDYPGFSTAAGTFLAPR